MEEPATETVQLCGPLSKKRCMEYALVLTAMGIACEVTPRDGSYALMVEAPDADRAWAQLQLYRHERQARPTRFRRRLGLHDGLICACLYGVTILLFDMLARNDALGLDWWWAGMSQAGMIRAGEWWRAMTALALHADSLHLFGNLAFGMVFSYFAGGLLGWGAAWGGMLLAGALGNALNALAQPPDHSSIGASTAVFATVGILAAYNWATRGPRINRWAPLGGGIALLAFIGMQGERTDVFAHIAGFGAGCLFGVVFAALEARGLVTPGRKHALGLAATLLFALSWVLALTAGG